jgi:FtsZ-interacting cell division protein ZipA
MSELQLWLVVLGVVIVVAVLIVNKMQEARAQRRTERAFGDKPADVLLGEMPGSAQPVARNVEAAPDHIEPAIAAPVAPDLVAPLSTDRIDHSLGLPTPPALPVGAGPVLDPRVDGIATIVMSAAQPGEEILRHAEALLVEVERSIAWEGLEETGQRWVKLSPKLPYQAIRVGIQLVDRRGQVNEAELNRAFARLQELAATLTGELQLPSRNETLRTAQRLDAFCSEVDVQIGLNIIKRDASAFVGTRIRQVVEAAGCVLGRDGRFRRTTPGGESYFVANLEPSLFLADTMASLSTHAITAVLDVPRVSSTNTTFAAFREFAFQLAKTLDAQVVDDNRQPIQAAALEAIGVEVEGIRARMTAEGMEPGGAIALRVFA